MRAIRAVLALCVIGLTGCLTVPIEVVEQMPTPLRQAPQSDLALRGADPVVIKNNYGGQIISFEAERARLAEWGGPVEIRGGCASACVIFTTLPNACLGPNAKIGFHRPNVNFGPIGVEQLGKYLRGGIREKWYERWQFVPNSEMHYISAERYVRLDPQARICPAR